MFINGHQNIEFRPDANGVPFKIDGELCKIILLTRGHFCIVSEEDYGFLTQIIWSASTRREGLESCKRVRAFGNLYGDMSARHGGRRGIHMHNVILERMGEWTIEKAAAGLQGDHKNGRALDNRRSNLRMLTQGEQNRNIPAHSNNPTGFIGVQAQRWRDNHCSYRSRLIIDGVSHKIRNPETGTFSFSTPEAAYDARLWVEQFLQPGLRQNQNLPFSQ